MTTLPERLLEALKWYVENDETIEGDEPLPEHHGLSWNEINAPWLEGKRRAIEAIEAAQALQAAPEGGCRTPIAWAVETEHYGRGYSFSNEFIETFPNAPVSFGILYFVTEPKGGDFHEILYGANLRLILDPDGDGDDANEVSACIGATFGDENKLDIFIQAGTHEAPIKLSAVPSPTAALQAGEV